MFPKINVNVPQTTEDTSNNLGKSFLFDFKKNKFVLRGGDVKQSTKLESIKNWIELFIRVEKDKYKIYDENFGTDFSDLVGYRLPRSYQVSEITRRINDGILNNCPCVTAVKGWKFDKGHFEFTVVTNTGEEVNING